MKLFQKTLCVMLSIVMALSCLSVAAFAADGEKFTSTLKTPVSIGDNASAKATLDMIDGILADEQIKFEVKEIGIYVDFTSVNALCNTIDEYLFELKTITFLFGYLLGDLKELDLSTWKKDMSRPGDDVTILREIIELLEANKSLISGICDASIDLGVFKNYLDISTILGDDGISGAIKEELIDMIYPDDTNEYDIAYEKYKNDIDSFLYGELLPLYTSEMMPGLEIDSSSTIETILIDVYNILFAEVFRDMLGEIDVDLSTSPVAELRALGKLLNLKGSTYNLEGFTLSRSGLKGQINNMLGKYVKLFVPSYTGWVNGGYENLKTNLEKAVKFVATETGIIKNAANKTLEQIAVEIAVIIINNIDMGAYEDGLTECKTLEDMFAAFLRNTAKEMKIGVNYNGNESYLVVAGDILAATAYDIIPFTDTNGKAYYAGGGKDFFEVLNYILNYLLFDRQFAAFMGLSTSKTESYFTKLDKIADYFGQNKQVNFNSKNFFLGTADKKGLFDCILTLDIGALLDLTIIPALDKAGPVSAVEFIYKSVQYFFNNWAGKSLLPAYRDKAFTNALSNESIANMVTVLLETVNSRRSASVSLLTYALYLSTAIGAEKTETAIESASVADCVATGKALTPNATVKAGGKTLKQGTDFIVIANSSAPGTATATIKGIGFYSGEIERSFNVLMGSVSSVSYTSTGNTVKLSWTAVPYADSYKISQYNTTAKKYEEIATVNATTYTASGLNPSAEYKYSVQAVSALYGSTQAKEVTAYTAPAAVSSSSVKYTATPTTVKLSWSAVSGATEYKVEQSTSSGWKTVATVSGTSATVSSLSSFTTYSFRITAVKKLAGGTALTGTPVTVNAKTTLATTSSLKASATATTITLTWSKVSKATKYDVLQYTGGKWKKLKTVTGTSYKVTGLKAGTKYKFAVRAAAVDGKTTVNSANKELTTYTSLSKPSSVKVSSLTATSAKLSWSKVSKAQSYTVYAYISGKWVNKGSTKKTAMTVKGLPSGKKTKLKVRATAKLDGKTVNGVYSSEVTAQTLPAKVSGLKWTKRSTTSISLSWKKTTGATSYEVYRKTGSKWKKLATTSKTSYTDSKSLKKGTEYQYKVRAVQKISSKTTRYGEYSSVIKAKATLFGSVKR